MNNKLAINVFIGTFIFSLFLGYVLSDTNDAVVETKTKIFQPNQKVSDEITVVAVGDSVCSPGFTPSANKCKADDVAKLTKNINPQYILFLGDLQYNRGTPGEFEYGFDKIWGDQVSKIYPTPGNHEYKTKNASGYTDYIEQNDFAEVVKSNPLTYAFDVNNWSIYSINSNCFTGVAACDEQGQLNSFNNLLRNDKNQCQIAFWHHPEKSSGNYYDNNYFGNKELKHNITPYQIAVNNNIEVVLNGHDHLYEHLQQNNTNQFIVGTGGVGLYKQKGTANTSKKVITNNFGVLVLHLKAKEYNWQFVNIDNEILDSGKSTCN